MTAPSPTPTDLHCPTCNGVVYEAPMALPGTDGPDHRGYQCGGGDPCGWVVIWPDANHPMTDVLLAQAVRS